jgi:hypothetical protein
MDDPRTDEELLAAVKERPEAFGIFYRRHVRPLLGYLVRRTGDAELAADLCAETFAAALDGLHRFDPARGAAVAWLYGIARRLLSHAAQRGVVEHRARRRLGMTPLELTDEALERIEAEASEVATAALDALPRWAVGRRRSRAPSYRTSPCPHRAIGMPPPMSGCRPRWRRWAARCSIGSTSKATSGCWTPVAAPAG